MTGGVVDGEFGMWGEGGVSIVCGFWGRGHDCRCALGVA